MKHPRRAFLVGIGLVCALLVVTCASVLGMVTPGQVAAGFEFIGNLLMIAIVGQVGVRVLALVFDWAKRPADPREIPQVRKPQRPPEPEPRRVGRETV